MKVKMCGLYRPEDIAYANEVQPDYVGFVFYEKSHRAVTKEQAAEYRKKLLPGIRAVGVFVNEDPKNIIELLEEGILDVAQLHGDETEEDIQYLQAVCHKPVIKAVKVRDRYDVEAWLDTFQCKDSILAGPVYRNFSVQGLGRGTVHWKG